MGEVIDPGWSAAIPAAVRGIIPFLADRQLDAVRPRIIGARARFLAAVIQQWLILGVLVIIDEPTEQDSLLPWILVGSAGLVDLFAVTAYQRSAIRRMTVDAKPVEVVFPLLQKMMVVFALTPALVGFAGFFLGGGLPVYVVGMVASHLCLFLGRPTESQLERIQRRVDEIGLDLDIRDAVLSE